jgi:hypothetical protein
MMKTYEAKLTQMTNRDKEKLERCKDLFDHLEVQQKQHDKKVHQLEVELREKEELLEQKVKT